MRSCSPAATTTPSSYGTSRGVRHKDRRRIFSLSLSNTGWYLLQLKNERPHGALKVPMSFSDDQIKMISDNGAKSGTPKIQSPGAAGNLQEVRYHRHEHNEQSSSIHRRSNHWIRRYPGNKDTGYHDENIIDTNKWERPICFAITICPGIATVSRTILKERAWFTN